MAADDRTVRRDAVLTLVVLVPAAVAAVVLPAPRSPSVFAGGVVATVLIELLLSVRSEQVRAVWATPHVQVGAVLVALGGGGLLVVTAGPWVVTFLLGGLCSYLVVLAGSVVWRRGKSNR
jgi:hypothetical protein